MAEVVARALQWRYDDNSGLYVAPTSFGRYEAWQVVEGQWWWHFPDKQRLRVDSFDDAKAAAQADFEFRVRAVLSDTPPASGRG
jgi:hypothetical protein